MQNLESFLDKLKVKVREGKISNELMKKISELEMLYTFDNSESEIDKETEKFMKYFITGWYIHTQLLGEEGGK